MLVLGVALLACFPPTGPNTGQDEVEAWTEDVVVLVDEIERLHPSPWFGIPKEEFERAVDDFLARLGADEEANLVEFMRLFAQLARAGRDGHSVVWSQSFDALPLRLYRFEDGWFVVAADPPHGELVGQRLLEIAGRPVEEVAAVLAPLLTRDNEWNLRAKLAGALTTPLLLRGTGIQPGPGPVVVRFGPEDGPGNGTELALEPTRGFPPPDVPPPVGTLSSTRDRSRPWWSEVLPAERALYVQFNEVRAADAAGTLAAFAGGLPELVENQGLERVIVDVRWNGGGDNTTFGPLIAALRDPRIDRPGRLFGLIGRHTFSAAGNFVTVLERDTGALLVGEPTGGAPNQYGDALDVSLPNHDGLLVRVVTRYHAFSTPDDPRLTHEPDLVVPLSSADYFAGRDPVLARALAHAPR